MVVVVDEEENYDLEIAQSLKLSHGDSTFVQDP